MAAIILYTCEVLNNNELDSYHQGWLKHENLALQAENEEINMKCNKS